MNSWEVCFGISVLIAIVFLTARWYPGLFRKKPGAYFYALGAFLASTVMFLPCYYLYFAGETPQVLRVIKTFILSIHNSIHLFIVDGEYDFVLDHITGLPGGWFYHLYTLYFAVLYVAAPALTFSIVLSYARRIYAFLRYLFKGWRKDAYVFSELNDRSLALAKSFMDNDKKCQIIFTDVYEGEGEVSSDRMAKAKEVKAICFRDDIADLDLSRQKHNKKLSFFIIGPDNAENIDQLKRLTETYGKRDHTSLYLFSASTESELIISTIHTPEMKVRRVNEARNTVYNNLYNEGLDIFNKALPAENGQKKISVLLAGLGSYGFEMLKALPWFCQMTGYQVTINVFDKDKSVETRFRAECPELMDDAHNGVSVEGEAAYTIRFHTGIDLMSQEFEEEFQTLDIPTYAFVSLGDDSLNVDAATRLRMLILRRIVRAGNLFPAGWFTKIQTIVYDSSRKEKLNELCYNIEFIGDLATSFSEEVVLHADLERQALKRHMGYSDFIPTPDGKDWQWTEERRVREKEKDAKPLREREEEAKKEALESFWGQEYNYRSSMSSVIHAKMRQELELPGADKLAWPKEFTAKGENPAEHPEYRTPEQSAALSVLEHRRWNAYMRSEGYCYCSEEVMGKEKDLAAKLHCCLLPFEQIPQKKKDEDLDNYDPIDFS